MIEINETMPVEASLTIVLRGLDVDMFKAMFNTLDRGCVEYYNPEIARKVLEAISS